MIDKIKECEILNKFRNELMDEFIYKCNGNDFNSLALVTIGETIDRVFSRFEDRLLIGGNINEMDKKIKVKLRNFAYEPIRAHTEDAGLDLRSPYDIGILPGDSVSIDTGVHIAIPKGYVGMLKSKSGLNVKYGITSEGVIDAGYTGSIVVKLYNNSSKAYGIEKGDKISQLVIMPIITPEIEYVDSLDDTERGSSGFGSSGK
jgi:dUTP pyrophosphatase